MPQPSTLQIKARISTFDTHLKDWAGRSIEPDQMRIQAYRLSIRRIVAADCTSCCDGFLLLAPRAPNDSARPVDAALRVF